MKKKPIWTFRLLNAYRRYFVSIFFSMKNLYQINWIIESVYTIKERKKTQKLKFMITINDNVGPENLHLRK